MHIRHTNTSALARVVRQAHGQEVLDEFITTHREAIIESARARVAARTCPRPSTLELTQGIPVFLDQLGDALRLARSTALVDHQQIELSATRHGHDLLRNGLTIGQVVHDYGDVCQSITELAVQLGADIAADDFRTLNLCLDDAIAGAVTEYARQRELALTEQSNERLGVFAHELRNALSTATLAFAGIQSGHVAPGGSTGLLLGRSLSALREQIDRSLAEVRLEAHLERFDLLVVSELIEELEISAFIQAQSRGLHFSASSLDRSVMVRGDRHILLAALANLLHNAFKFTRKHTGVSLRVTASESQVTFEIEDECGGLAPGAANEMFLPFTQQGSDRTGLGLGLGICLKAVQAHDGTLEVRDLPGKGCVFTLTLPRATALPGTESACTDSPAK
ncbi:MAG TPA: HAMP domain-containing sensor histidine kinase [Polyangiales bacterium]